MSTVAPFPIVGIGASAGGLHALEDFFKPVPAQPGMAFVILTHLAPDRDSYLTEILARHTDLPVQVAIDDQKVEINRVYVLPPNASLTIAGGRLRSERNRARPPRTLAYRCLLRIACEGLRRICRRDHPLGQRA